MTIEQQAVQANVNARALARAFDKGCKALAWRGFLATREDETAWEHADGGRAWWNTTWHMEIEGIKAQSFDVAALYAGIRDALRERGEEACEPE